jgi:thymidylate synthase ThyX
MWELRLKNDTQQETREVAEETLRLVQQINGNPFEHTLKSWGY